MTQRHHKVIATFDRKINAQFNNQVIAERAVVKSQIKRAGFKTYSTVVCKSIHYNNQHKSFFNANLKC